MPQCTQRLSAEMLKYKADHRSVFIRGFVYTKFVNITQIENFLFKSGFNTGDYVGGRDELSYKKVQYTTTSSTMKYN